MHPILNPPSLISHLHYASFTSQPEPQIPLDPSEEAIPPSLIMDRTNPRPESNPLLLRGHGDPSLPPPGSSSVQAPIEAMLSLDLQALNLQDPEIASVQAAQETMELGADAKFNMLIILAATGMSPARVLNLQTLQQAMAKAWRSNYHGISQVSRSMFMAHFRTLEAMMFVITRQPCIMGSDNLLLEWLDPSDEAKEKEDYRFDTIYVTIRIYGVPRSFRSIQLLRSILEQVGEPSEFHPLHQGMLYAKAEYMWGTARLQINSPIKDRIMVNFPNESSGLAYLFYEKIGRICTFCGIMFHNVQGCPLRNQIILNRQKKRNFYYRCSIKEIWRMDQYSRAHFSV